MAAALGLARLLFHPRAVRGGPSLASAVPNASLSIMRPAKVVVRRSLSRKRRLSCFAESRRPDSRGPRDHFRSSAESDLECRLRLGHRWLRPPQRDSPLDNECSPRHWRRKPPHQPLLVDVFVVRRQTRSNRSWQRKRGRSQAFLPNQWSFPTLRLSGQVRAQTHECG